MSKVIEIIISSSGESRVETKGFTGNSCRDASRYLEQALGQAIHERVTAEFHGVAAQQQAQLTASHEGQ